jgi:hypothetical protein
MIVAEDKIIADMDTNRHDDRKVKSDYSGVAYRLATSGRR